jgi:hypothetical protein
MFLLDVSNTAVEIVKTVFTFLGALSVPAFAYLTVRWKDREKKFKNETDFLKDNIYTSKITKLKEIFDLKSFSLLEEHIHEVFSNTFVDRMTIMILMNGKVDFKFMSVIFDQDKEGLKRGLQNPYTKIIINEDYHDLVISLTIGNSIWLHKDFRRVGNISDYLEYENVKTIGYYKVKRIALDDYNDLLMYCSWSSKDDSAPSERQMKEIDLLTRSRVVPVINSIIKSPSVWDSEDLLDLIDTKGF